MRDPRRTTLTLIAGIVALGPVVLLLITSFASGWYWPALLPPGWSTRAWSYVLSPAAEMRRAVLTSFLIATAVGFTSVALALPAARAIALHSFRGKSAVVAALALPVVAPPLASTMGLHRMLLAWGLVDTAAGVALAHLPPALPYAVLAITAGFRRLDTELEAQARTLGATRAQVWRHVTLPAIAPGIVAGFCLAFLISWSQYLLTLLIGGGAVLTVPLELVAFQRSGDEGIAAALSLVFLAPAMLLLVRK